MKSLRFLIVLITVGAVAALIWNLYYRAWTGIDDANIYLAYMRNLSQGHGFVYNVGGERVEGFTSLLWTLAGAGLFLISDHVEQWLLALNILIVSYALFRLLSFIEDFMGQKALISPYGILFLGMAATTAGYFEWAVSALMETGLWSALLLLLSLEVFNAYARSHTWKDDFRFCLLLVLLILCRPEALLWSMVFIGLRAFRHWLLQGNFLQALRNHLIPLLLVVFTIAALTLWRIYYFGYPLPNTYYAKASADRMENIKQGILYIFRYIIGFNIWAIVIIPAAVGYLWQQKRLQALAEAPGLALLILLTAFVVPLVTGGDHFTYGRFIQPVAPSLWFWFILIWRNFRLPVTTVALAAILCFSAFTTRYSLANCYLLKAQGRTPFSPMAYEWFLVQDGRRAIQELHHFFQYQSGYPSIGVFAAGAAFTYKGLTYDLLGLNNVAMAHAERVKDAAALKNHASFNHAVFLQQQPDLFWLYDSICDKQTADNIHSIRLHNARVNMAKKIHQNPQFQQTYKAVVLSCQACPKAVITFASKQFLEQKLDKRYYTYRIIDYRE